MSRIYKTSLKPHQSFLIGLSLMLDGLISVLSFGYLCSSYTFATLTWSTISNLDKKKKELRT